MADIEEIKEALQYIDPVHLDYSEWLQVGMASVSYTHLDVYKRQRCW